MCARIEGANREVSKGKTDIRPRGLSVFFYVMSQQGAAAATERYFRGVFQGCTGLRASGCLLVRQLHQLRA